MKSRARIRKILPISERRWLGGKPVVEIPNDKFHQSINK